jgi:hypothetical protein
VAAATAAGMVTADSGSVRAREDRAAIRRVFHEVFGRGDGRDALDVEELAAVMATFGADESEVQGLLAAADTDHDGEIQFSEFEAAIGHSSFFHSARALFDSLDNNADGVLTHVELEDALLHRRHTTWATPQSRRYAAPTGGCGGACERGMGVAAR